MELKLVMEHKLSISSFLKIHHKNKKKKLGNLAALDDGSVFSCASTSRKKVYKFHFNIYLFFRIQRNQKLIGIHYIHRGGELQR